MIIDDGNDDRQRPHLLQSTPPMMTGSLFYHYANITNDSEIDTIPGMKLPNCPQTCLPECGPSPAAIIEK